MTDAEDDDSQIFPQRLMQILSDEGNCESIAWLPHGRAFVVKSRTHFESIMPQYFSRKAKYSSFTRKLNRWNFVRVSSGPEAGSYYHEFFLRDKPHLVAQMFCKNARSKLAMTGSVVQGPSKDATVAIAPSRIEPVSTVHHHRMEPNHQQQQQQAYNLDIPLALLHLLVKPAPSDPQQQLSAAGAQPQPGILLQQSQYANLLLERQIQILQQEQAEQMLHLLSQDSKPAASKEDQHLRQMQHIMQNNQQRQKKSPTNHRASAA